MAFTRPSLETIITRVKGDIKSATGLLTILRRSFLDGISKALAGASHMLHGHLTWVSKQIFPDQAEKEYLERWASIWGVGRIAATYAKQTITVTGVDASVLPAGTVLQTSDETQYTVDEDVTISGTTGTGVITCLTAGDIGNNDIGSKLNLVSPVTGVESSVEVAGITVEAEDEESDANLQDRLVARIQQPPSGGTASDYINWAKEVAAVTRAWVFPGHLGEGTVGLSFVLDGETDIIPGGAKVTEVHDYVSAKKPIDAELFTFAPVENTVDLNISIKPNTLAVRDAVTAELTDLFSREGNVAGAYKGVGESYDGVLKLSKINEAVSIAKDEDDHVLNSPTADIDPGTGGLNVLGTITWQTLA